MRLRWGLFFLLAFAVSPPAATILLVVVILRHRARREACGHPSVTLKGEVVRSESEGIIADYFSHSGITYVYEQPALRWGFRSSAGPTSTSLTTGSTSSSGGWSTYPTISPAQGTNGA